MKLFFRSTFYGVIAHWKPIILLIAIIIGSIITIDLVGRAVSHWSGSCKFCHYMKPYHEQWATSTHNEVACIKCHSFSFNYMLSSVIKYATNTQSPRPHAVVEDKACLQSGCHSNQLLEGDVKFEKSILFNHADHAGAPKRGVNLKCSSCHYTLVQSKEHLAVDKNVCVLCHFKGTGKGQAISGCKACHGEPKDPVKHEGFVFDHEAYLQLGVACNQCHVDVAEGTGDVPIDVCHECHVERIERYDDFLFIHNKHVTEKGRDCFECHTKIKHGEIHLVKTLEIKCQGCHTDLHTPQKELYMGINGRGVKDTPSRMFAAQVACDGCHVKGVFPSVSHKPTSQKERRKILRESCVTCHGKGYDKMLDDWLEEMPKLTNLIEPSLKKAERAISKRPRFAKTNPDIAKLIADARHNYNLLKEGHGAHNVEFAVYLADETMNQLDEALNKLSRDYVPPTRPDILRREDAFCTKLCHNTIQPEEKVYFTEMQLNFPHTLHSKDIGIACTVCHSADKHKQRIITKSGCIDCHHAAQDISCAHCHKPQNNLYKGKLSYRKVESAPDFMAAAGITCDGCHDLTAEDQTMKTINVKCFECHGEGYDQIGIDWLKELTTQENVIALKLVELHNELDQRRKKGMSVKHIDPILNDIESGFKGLRRSRPIHNYALSLAIFEQMQKDIEQANVLLKSTQE